MALNPTKQSRSWNYSRPNDEGYSLSITGTVIGLQEVQAMNFGNEGMPSTPKFWENDGKPMMNIRMILVGKMGSYRTLTFQPASKAAKEGKAPSLHMDLFNLSGGKNILDLIGKTIRITTVAPPAGFTYGKGSPRPWHVELVPDEGPYQLTEPLEPVYEMPVVLADNAVSGGTVNQPQHPHPQPSVSFEPGPYQQAPKNPDYLEEIPF